jgi:Domain of unknown function (DUF3850)
MSPIELKTVNPFFQGVWDRKKKFEIRLNDRDFQVGQVLMLKEYCPERKIFLGRWVLVQVKYVLTSDQFPQGLQPGYAAMSCQEVDRSSSELPDLF